MSKSSGNNFPVYHLFFLYRYLFSHLSLFSHPSDSPDIYATTDLYPSQQDTEGPPRLPNYGNYFIIINLSFNAIHIIFGKQIYSSFLSIGDSYHSPLGESLSHKILYHISTINFFKILKFKNGSSWTIKCKGPDRGRLIWKIFKKKYFRHWLNSGCFWDQPKSHSYNVTP